MKNPTPRQFELLTIIKAHIREHGKSPSVEELMAPMMIATRDGVQIHLKALERKGRIKRKNDAARTIVVVQDSELPKPAGITRVSNRECKAASGDRVVRPRRGLRAKSRTNSNKHVNLYERNKYAAANLFDEIAHLFPPAWCHGYVAVPTDERGGHKVVLPRWEVGVVHHVLWGQARRHDIVANMIVLIEICHLFVHRWKTDGLVLCLFAKKEKGELQWDELKRISGKDIRGWLSTKRCTFDWCEAYRLKLIGGESC